MVFGIFDRQTKKRMDDTAYTVETLLRGMTFETRDEAHAVLARMRRNRLYNWRTLGVREVCARDLERTIQVAVS